MNPVGGLVYYISAPESLAAAAANPLHTLFYVAFMLGSEWGGGGGAEGGWVAGTAGWVLVGVLCAT